VALNSELISQVLSSKVHFKNTLRNFSGGVFLCQDTQVELAQTLAALVAGGAIGAVLGFVGAGGAMLTVPILVYGFSYPAHQASVAAIAVVIVAAASGLYPRIKSNDVLIKEAIIISGLGAFANIESAQLVRNISDEILITGFSAVIIFAGTTMLRKPVQSPEKPIPLATLIVLSFVIGSLTGLFGIGGGFLAIPVLVLAFNTPQNKAAGTSLLIIVLNSCIALLAHHSTWQEINWQIPIYMSLSAVLVGNLAGKKSVKTNPELIRKTFALLLFSIAAFTLIETWLI
jgi:uncharacterized membrane protein YfcA